MKAWIAAIIFGSLFLLGAKSSSNEAGRFVLFEGETTNIGGSTSDAKAKLIPRMDSQSGKTWMFISTANKATGENVTGWALIDDLVKLDPK